MYSGILRPTNTQLHNLNLVLKEIKNCGPLSRADIARSLTCSKSTVTNIIGQLIQFGLIHESGKGNPSTGRKSTLLSFNPRTGYVIAVDTRPPHVYLSVTDLSGNEVSSLSLEESSTEKTAFIENLIQGIDNLIKKSGIERNDFIAIGLMISGIVDPSQGIVVFSALLDWKGPVRLAEIIQTAIKIPVFIENDVNALALAEFWLGCAQNARSIAYIYVDKKIGGAYIDDGFIIQGEDFAFAEFGKLIVSGDGGPEQLESRLSITTLCKRFGIEADPKDTEALSAYFSVHPEKKEKLFQFMAEGLAQVISSIVAILNPGVIILGGFTRFEPDLIERITSRSRELLPLRPDRTVRLLSASLHEHREILGGTAIAINKTRFSFIVQG